MARADRHYEVAARIVTLIKTQTFTDIQSSDVELIDYPYEEKPTRGIFVSMLEEQEGVGLNDYDDWRYRCLVTRIYGQIQEGQQERSKFRVIIRDLFHNKRFMNSPAGACDILGAVRPSKMKMPKGTSAGEVSQMVVSALIREVRDV